MAFELEPGKSIRNAVPKVVQGRIEKALTSLDGHRRPIGDKGVHDARKRLKEIRATLRLVRDELGERTFQRENRTFRDAGRPLSALRDATVLIQTLDGLVSHFDQRVRPATVDRLRRYLIQRRRVTRQQLVRHDRGLVAVSSRLRRAKDRPRRWSLAHRGWRGLEHGLRAVYARGRRTMRTIGPHATDETLHEWRKQAQYLRYELELLEPSWPEAIESMADQVHHLTDLLGDDHDLAVLTGIVRDTTVHVSPTDRELILALIDERRGALQREARALGARLYEESPRAFVERLHGYWRAPRS